MPEWEERYAVGVESIDRAHQEMFAVISRVQRMIRIGGNVKWTVAEAIKYFKSYTIRHFEDEEAYMRSINYGGYENHKAIHSGMRERIIPRLFSHLENSKYSDEAVSQFLMVCEKWLSRHILGHDRDLVKWSEQPKEESDAQG